MAGKAARKRPGTQRLRSVQPLAAAKKRTEQRLKRESAKRTGKK
jgi:hypothetical protein